MGQKKALFAMAVEGDTSTKKPITKEAEEQWATSLCPAALTLKTGVRVMDILARIQHH